jgi:hypothetical protein
VSRKLGDYDPYPSVNINYFGYKIKGDKQVGCVTHTRDGRGACRILIGKRSERNNFEGLCKYGRLLFERIFKK